MNTVIQAWIYRRTLEDIEYLVVQRSEQDGGWRQPITGHTEPRKSVITALHREIQEETGITKFLTVSDELYSYKWDYKDEHAKDVVYALEVSQEAQIVLNPDEHQAYQWLSFEAATKILKHAGNKTALQIVNRHLAS